eukprot:g24783.t1
MTHQGGLKKIAQHGRHCVAFCHQTGGWEIFKSEQTRREQKKSQSNYNHQLVLKILLNPETQAWQPGKGDPAASIASTGLGLGQAVGDVSSCFEPRSCLQTGVPRRPSTKWKIKQGRQV